MCVPRGKTIHAVQCQLRCQPIVEYMRTTTDHDIMHIVQCTNTQYTRDILRRDPRAPSNISPGRRVASMRTSCSAQTSPVWRKGSRGAARATMQSAARSKHGTGTIHEKPTPLRRPHKRSAAHARSRCSPIAISCSRPVLTTRDCVPWRHGWPPRSHVRRPRRFHHLLPEIGINWQCQTVECDPPSPAPRLLGFRGQQAACVRPWLLALVGAPPTGTPHCRRAVAASAAPARMHCHRQQFLARRRRGLTGRHGGQ